MTHAVYVQATGQFCVLTPRPVSFYGYAGRREGRNQPVYQRAKNIGPLPRGLYSVSAPSMSETHGPFTFRLTPDDGTEMFGRSGFLIHGDNVQHDASRGCIILARPAREFIARHKVTTLEVVANGVSQRIRPKALAA